MMATDHEYFEDIEIEHGHMAFYANGCVEYATTECIGSNYEGYAFEIVHTREITNITMSALWYTDEDTGSAIDILFQKKYREMEEIAKEAFRYQFE